MEIESLPHSLAGAESRRGAIFSSVRALQAVTVGGILALVLGPKFATIWSINAFLWGTLTGFDYVLVCLQDLALASLLCAVALRSLHAGRVACVGAWVAISLVAFLTVVDMRARSIWLKPLDWAQVEYFFDQLSGLRSSMGMFFAGAGAFGLSFKKLLVLWGLLLATTWGATFRLRVLRSRKAPGNVSGDTRKAWTLALACAVAFAGLSLAVPRYLYNAERNPFVSGFLRAITPSERPKAKVRFEQPNRPIKEVLAGPRVRLQDVAPFKNLVIMVLESFRFRGHEFTSDNNTPHLSRLANEGLWAKAYVSVPHSSKGHYAIFTGRAPSSGVEIREATKAELPTVIAELRDTRNARTSAFSAQYLGFENTDGLLKAIGFNEAVGPDELGRLSGDPNVQTSYGTDDAALIEAPARLIAEQRGDRPFAVTLLTINAHHPYVYPEKANVDEDSFPHYERAIAHTDRVIDGVVGAFQKHGLAEDTLFVFVADHGESFGEHGSHIHNNSLYEEEITVPLVFWSADGRLKHAGGLEARQIDVAPTIADLMGLHTSTVMTQGVSLLRAQKRPPAFAFTFFEDVGAALVLDGEKYMYWPSNDRLIRFDLTADPMEQKPQEVAEPAREKVLTRIRSAQAYEAEVWGIH